MKGSSVAGRALLIVVALGLISVVNPASAGVLAQSTFDTDVDGWVTFTTAAGFPLSNISFVAGGGNPGGTAQHDAPSEDATSFFFAPSKFITALHSAIDGSIAWDEATINPGGPSFASIDIQVAAGFSAESKSTRLRVQRALDILDAGGFIAPDPVD
jgi:hypothetical protein